MKNPKTIKIYHFNEEWEHNYFFIMIKGKCCCLLCNNSISLAKKGNLERHYKTLHTQHEAQFPLYSIERKAKLAKLKKDLFYQQVLLNKEISKSKASTIASLRISHVLAKHKKSFSDGSLMKIAFIEAASALFNEFKNKAEIIVAISDLQLSRNTVADRVDKIACNLKDQLLNDISNCQAYSLQLDESTDGVGIAQMIVFIRMIFSDFSIKEELLTIIPLKGNTRGRDLFEAFKIYCGKFGIGFSKLVSITTDGAPAMVGCRNGFLALCKQDPEFPEFLQYHCIIHQQVLCAKILNMSDIIDITYKISNSIRAKSLQRRLFKLQVEETSNYRASDLLMFTDIRWLSRGKFLQRFRDLIDEVKIFLIEKGEDCNHLNNDSWLLDLAFLTDITTTLNNLNLNLQGANKNIFHLISSIDAFRDKLTLLIMKLDNKNLSNFPNMVSQLKQAAISDYDANKYANEIRSLKDQFNSRFEDFKKIEQLVLFFCNPFATILNTELIAQCLSKLSKTNEIIIEDEIIRFKNDIYIKSTAVEDDVWKHVNESSYPNLKKCARDLYSCFGSTYLCESAFSQMKIIKSKYRTNLSDFHLESCLRNGLSQYTPNYEQIIEDMNYRATNNTDNVGQ